MLCYAEIMNEELSTYIKDALGKGVSKEEINKSLLDKGWKIEDIDIAFASLSQSGKETKPHAPLIVIIVSWLILLGSIGSLLLTLPLLLIGGLGQSFTVLALGLLNLVRGGGLVVVSFGLRNMRKWALYVYTALVLLGILIFIYDLVTSPKPDLARNVEIVIEAIILIYFWIIYKKFI